MKTTKAIIEWAIMFVVGALIIKIYEASVKNPKNIEWIFDLLMGLWISCKITIINSNNETN